MIRVSLLSLLLAFACFDVVAGNADVPAAAAPQIETRVIEFEHDGVTYQGYLARPRDIDGEVPGVLVIHEWWGLNEFARLQTRRLAELGYVAFAADMYGNGRTTDDPQVAGRLAGQLYADRPMMRRRAVLGLATLAQQTGVDNDRLGAIGYCFGGTVAVETGYAKTPLKAAVSFHGNPMPAQAGDENIAARFLILHGTADTLVPEQRLEAFSEALEEHGAEYRIIRYEGAKHSFTNPAADALGMDGVGYDAQAAAKSWADMQAFFNEVFRTRTSSPAS